MRQQQATVEGRWEEILRHASQFAGRRVRVTLLPERSKRATRRKHPKPVDEETARFLQDFAGSWAGDDLDECLKFVTESRTG